jgi:hypothetical protein
MNNNNAAATRPPRHADPTLAEPAWFATACFCSPASHHQYALNGHLTGQAKP